MVIRHRMRYNGHQEGTGRLRKEEFHETDQNQRNRGARFRL